MTDKTKNIDEIAKTCSTCGNCLHSCPVYNAQWVEPNSPRGKINLIKALRDGRLEMDDSTKKLLYHCVLCGSCQNICTKGVEFVDMMVEVRNEVAQGRKIPFVKKAILQLYQSLLFKKFTWVVDILYRTPLKNHLLLPKRKRANLKKIQAEGKPGETYDIMLYPGCVMTHFYPGLLEKTYNYLKKKGYSVVVPKNTKCCGFPYKTQGWGEKFEKLKSRNSKIFSRYKFKQVIAPCGTCVMALRDYYDMEGIKVWELTEFFKKHLSDAEVKSAALAADGKKVTWHDPCHHLKSLGLGDAPRHFMKQLGDDFVDDKSALCCGFGGIFSVGFPDTSKKIFQRKEEKLNELEAGTVVTACPGCYLQLSTKLQQEVKFFIELFDEEV